MTKNPSGKKYFFHTFGRTKRRGFRNEWETYNARTSVSIWELYISPSCESPAIILHFLLSCRHLEAVERFVQIIIKRLHNFKQLYRFCYERLSIYQSFV